MFRLPKGAIFDWDLRAVDMSQASSHSKRHILVCICTCMRDEMLSETLESIVGQRFAMRSKPSISIIVIDNAGEESTRLICERVADATGADIHYVIEPTRGISYARNRALTVCGKLGAGDIAFIDDDEVAAPNCLEELLKTQDETGADIVQGVCFPRLPPTAPCWMDDEGYFVKPGYKDRCGNGKLTTASTYNVLVRRAVLFPDGAEPALWFDDRYAFTGGEDTAFFSYLVQTGATAVLSRSAIVRETIPHERARICYLLKRRWSNGANSARRDGRAFSVQIRVAARKLVKAMYRCCSNIARERTIATSMRYCLYQFSYELGYIHGIFGGCIYLYRTNEGHQPVNSDL